MYDNSFDRDPESVKHWIREYKFLLTELDRARDAAKCYLSELKKARSSCSEELNVSEREELNLLRKFMQETERDL